MEAVDLKKLRRNLFGLSAGGKVKRSLFGEVDHEEVKRDLERELKETLQQKSKLWNFDFEKYCPRDEIIDNGLQWTPCPITEHSMVERRSYVSTSFNESIPITRLSTIDHTDENKRKSQSPIKNILSSATPDVIEIINGSPIRNLTPSPKQRSSPTEKCSVKFDMTESLNTATRAGKRKRSSQATIDDFMKKKKPRTNMEFHSTKKSSSSISSRLRSSPSKVQVTV